MKPVNAVMPLSISQTTTAAAVVVVAAAAAAAAKTLYFVSVGVICC